MSNLYPLTARIHELLPQVCTKNNIEQIEVESEYVIIKTPIWGGKDYEYSKMSKNNWIAELLRRNIVEEKTNEEVLPEIAEKQLRQILVGLKEVLGGNSGRRKYTLEISVWHDEYMSHHIQNYDEYNNTIQKEYDKLIEKFEGIKYEPKSKSKALDDRWLGATEDKQGKYQLPLFNRQPETVLQELVEILENLLN